MLLSDVSVVIPTYNALSHLKRTIKCLELQKPDPSLFEVIVVDDGSTDGTGKWLKRYNGVLNLTELIHPDNRGRSVARNTGVRNSNNRLLVLLDGDMEFSSSFISNHATLHSGGKRAIIGVVRYDQLKRPSGYARYLETRGAIKLNDNESIPGRYFLSGNSSLLREDFEAVGGFDEDLTFYGEDIDFGVRLIKSGVKLALSKEICVQHLHVRPLSSALKLANQFGRIGIPKLVDRHPELYSQFRLDWLDKGKVELVFRKFLISFPVYISLLGLTSILDTRRAPAIFYSYLIFRNYFCGFYSKSEALNS